MKNSIYLIILLVLIVAGVALFKMQRKSTFDANYDRTFGYKDTASITKVFFADMQGNKVRLERNENGKSWTLNSAYKAEPVHMELLLNTIRRMEVFRPLQQAAIKNVLTEMTTHGVKVELYKDRETEPFQVFYIGNAISGEKNGSPMVKDGSQSPQIVYIQGFEGELKPRFYPYYQSWRDRVLINGNSGSIQNISLIFPSKQAESFRLTNKNGKDFYVSDINKQNETKINAGIAKNYLDKLQRIYVEGYIQNSPRIDSCKAVQPFCLLIVNNSDDTIKMYRKAEDKHTRSYIIENGDTTNLDAEKMYLFCNKNKDFALIDISSFSRLLTTKSTLIGKKMQ